ncbi:MAG: isoleucine--tRNA ligase [Endomicrobiales bacterium]|nr:isoleucine--tRNA ligase [Endomicrobiales bacterium]
MDYSKTVNLPKTDFPMKAGLSKREPEKIEKWETLDIYRKMRQKSKGKKKFLLHDGPPYANGRLHLGTALNKILKDIIVKFKVMAGYDSPYTPGWDCHGLPIEQALMKEMKADKHKVNLVDFRKKAAEFANKFIDIQRNEFKRLGVFGDWYNPYLTMNPKYEGVIVKVFGDLVKKGYIYRQKKPVYWCPTCETALADAEVEYADHISHSVFVKFQIKEIPDALKGKVEEKASVLIWTTTPWTLPANVALAFQSEADYVNVKIELPENKTENLIMAKRLLPVVAESLKSKEYKIFNEFMGTDLEGIRCQNPLVDRQSVGVLGDFVSLDDGTGVVHIAPGHGQEDYQVGLKYSLPIISPVDDKGVFTDEAGEFKGHKVFAANHLIIEKLKSSGALLFEEKLTHSYPHCWRCKRAIIFRATEQWFLSVEHNELRNRMKETIDKVKWVPSYGRNRIIGMVESRPDWCLSRQRLWGVPIPVVYCKACNQPILDDDVINRVVDLFSQHGSDIWFEKSIEEILEGVVVRCPKCGSTEFKKEQDILDVWFDSGVSHEAVLASGNFEGLEWPCDMYLEGSDQHRGWFQTSLIPAVALREKAPYKEVLTHGFVVDGEGKKMSKSLGNVIYPQEVIDKYGADILRLWVATSDYREDIRISQEILKGLTDTYRKIRNTLRFLLGNIWDFSIDKDKVAYKDMREIDRFALYKLQEVIKQVNNAYDSYEFHKAAVSINQFCTVFLSGFYLDVLKDTLYCDGQNWKSRKSAQTVLFEICSALARLLAPILSFTSEEVWQELGKIDKNCEESVFLASRPEINEKYVFSKELDDKWKKLSKTRDSVLIKFEELRKDKIIGSNMEGKLEILYSQNDKFLADEKELTQSVMGNWDIELKECADKSSETAVNQQGKSKFNKCERCWRFTEDVNNNNKFGGNLCSRCLKTLEETKVGSNV